MTGNREATPAVAIFVNAVEQGVGLGGAAGILAGLFTVALPGTLLVIAGGILLAFR